MDDFGKKFSIRALNFNMMSRLMMNPNTILSRASSKLLTSAKNRGT